MGDAFFAVGGKGQVEGETHFSASTECFIGLGCWLNRPLKPHCPEQAGM